MGGAGQPGSTTTPTVTPAATATPTGTATPEDKVVEANAQADVPEASATNNRLSGRLSGQGFWLIYAPSSLR